MKKIMFAMTILASAAAIVPANAAPRNSVANAKMFATSPGAFIRVGDQCWQQTDAGRGYGFWTVCGKGAVDDRLWRQCRQRRRHRRWRR